VAKHSSFPTFVSGHLWYYNLFPSGTLLPTKDVALISIKGLAEGIDGVQEGDWPHDGGAHYFQHTTLMLVTRPIKEERRCVCFQVQHLQKCSGYKDT